MAERSDGSLAPVTYLFGRPEAQPAERSAHPAGSAVHWAVPGLPVDEEPTPEPTRADSRAHNVGLNALARRGMSVAEMRALLEKRELDPEIIESEIARLTSVGLLDDDALAETLVRTLHDRKKLGRSAIASELGRRKIPSETVQLALEALDGDDELALATEVARKRASQLRGYDDATAYRRLSGYLQRRGYSGAVVSAATRAALQPAGGVRFE